MSIVVVEGADGSGKTTLIKNLRNATERYYVTLGSGGPPQNVLNVQCVTDWITMMSQGRVPVVCDRLSLISEPIYGEILRDENIFDGTYTIDDVKDFLLNCVDRVIYCRPPTSVILDKLKNEKQLKGVDANISAIAHKYDYTMKMLQHWGVRVINYDCSQNPLWDLDQLFFGDIS
jgi:GTPase SAR1 family protein